LTKDVAERQQFQKAYGMKQALPPPILGKLPFNGINAGQDVPMRQHYASRFCRGPGGKNDLRRIIAAELGWRVKSGGVLLDKFNQILQLHRWAIACVRDESG
jgi:hypothetical protein